MAIVTKQDCYEQIRIDDTADDAWLDIAIPAVESAVIRWCGGEDRIQDTTGEIIPCVKLATLVEIAFRYLNRESPTQKNQIGWFERGYSLSAGATSLLQSVRKPTVA